MINLFNCPLMALLKVSGGSSSNRGRLLGSVLTTLYWTRLPSYPSGQTIRDPCRYWNVTIILTLESFPQYEPEKKLFEIHSEKLNLHAPLFSKFGEIVQTSLIPKTI